MDWKSARRCKVSGGKEWQRIGAEWLSASGQSVSVVPMSAMVEKKAAPLSIEKM